MEDSEYKQDLKIDTEALEFEWRDQSELFMKYSELSALAKKTAKKIIERTKILRSELILEARQSGEAKNASQEEAYYRGKPDYQKAIELQIEAEFEADILDGAVFAFHQRKTALENLVRLAAQSYFATPEVPRDLGIEGEKFENSKRKKTVGDIKNRRKKGRRTRREESEKE